MLKERMQKSYRLLPNQAEDLQKVTKFFGTTEQMIIDVALTNFINLSREGQMKLIARYHYLLSRYMGLEESEMSEANILQLFDDAPPPKGGKKTKTK